MTRRSRPLDRKSTRLNSSYEWISYAVFCLKKKIHHSWTPLQERIKDYIASPKSNGYQSLHTTVFGPAGQLYEIQIRTRELHHTAEYGIAAHWLFKEGRKSPDELDRHLAWFRQLLELQQDAHTPEEFLEL